MIVIVKQTGTRLSLIAELSANDRQVAGKATLARTTVTFGLPDGFNKDDTHPDLLALASLVTFYPWIGNTLELPFAVSTRFAETVKRWTKITLPNASGSVPRRIPADDARPGLSFSAGVDSLAALAIMPENTLPVFSHRAPSPTGAASLYKADAPLHAVEEMNVAGRETHVVESDLEWIRQPVGFAVDPSPGVPVILLADLFRIDAIGFGTIAEAAYRTGSAQFIDYAHRPVFTRWQAILQSAGLSYYNCVAGISEIGTTAITRQSEFGHLAQSCVRGEVGAACMKCVKCFRKSLIEASISGDWPSPNEVSRMMSNRAIRSYLSSVPIRLEIVLAAALSGYAGADPLLIALQKRVAAETWDVSFTGGWYGPSLETMVPEKYQAETRSRLEKYIPKMTDSQEKAFQEFNIEPVIAAKSGDEIEEFLSLLTGNAA